MTNGVNHNLRDHSETGASGAERWTTCIAAVAMAALIEEKARKEESSPAAAEGTKFHELCDLMFGPLLLGWNMNREFSPEVVNMINNKDLEGLAIDNYPREMQDYCEQWIDILMERIKQFKPAKVMREVTVVWDEKLGLYGTADMFFAFKLNSKMILEVDDIKYGKLHVIEADALQLKYYAIAIEEHFNRTRPADKQIKFDEFWLHIYQPRAYHPHGEFRKYVMKRKEADETKAFLKGKAAEARSHIGKSEAELLPLTVAGTHCKFCPARGTCKTHIAYQSEQAGLDFAGAIEKDIAPVIVAPNEISAFISDEQVSKILNHRAAIKHYVSALESYAINRYLAGNSIPGWKVVKSAGKSKFKEDKVSIAKELKKLGIADPYERSLRGIGSIEAELKGLKVQGELKGDAAKKYIRSLIGDFLTKSAGSIALAEESDPRPAINNDEIAASDFENVTSVDVE